MRLNFMRANGSRERLLCVLLCATGFGIWEALARGRILSPMFAPAPSTIIVALASSITTGRLLPDLAATLKRVIAGFAIGGAAGVTLGLALGWSAKLRAFFDPLISATYPIPKIAILPLAMLVLGIGEPPRIAVIAVGAFFLVVINTMAGVRSIDPLYFDVVRDAGGRGWHVFAKVLLPGSAHMIFAGLRLALGVSLLLAVAVEFTSATRGLGAFLWRAWETLRSEEVYAGVLSCAALGLASGWIIQRLEKWLVPWRESSRHFTSPPVAPKRERARVSPQAVR